MHIVEKRESITLTNEGQKIFGVLHLPIQKTSTLLPAVLMCHGFAGNKAGKYRIYVSLAERLAQAGIASLRFDFRGSGDSEGSFSDMTIEGEVSDAGTALKFLKHFPGINPERIGLLGNSFGGAIAVLTASRNPGFKSLVLLAALFSSDRWKTQWEAIRLKGNDAQSMQETYKAFEGNVPGINFYKDFFTLNLEPHLEKLSTMPLLHVHSILDERIGIADADHYMRCRKGASAQTHSLRLKKCDHSFSDLEERMALIQEITQWFQKTL